MVLRVVLCAHIIHHYNFSSWLQKFDKFFSSFIMPRVILEFLKCNANHRSTKLNRPTVCCFVDKFLQTGMYSNCTTLQSTVYFFFLFPFFISKIHDNNEKLKKNGEKSHYRFIKKTKINNILEIISIFHQVKELSVRFTRKKQPKSATFRFFVFCYFFVLSSHAIKHIKSIWFYFIITSYFLVCENLLKCEKAY